MKFYILALALAGALFMGLTTVSVSPAEAPVLHQYDYEGADRGDCILYCRSRFLGEYTGFSVEEQYRGRSGFGRSGNLAYYQCVQWCEKKFWDAYDKEMDDLEKIE